MLTGAGQANHQFGGASGVSGMSISIHWRLMFRVNDRRALDRCLARTLPLFGHGVEEVRQTILAGLPVLPPPVKHLVRIHIVRSRYLRHRRPSSRNTRCQLFGWFRAFQELL